MVAWLFGDGFDSYRDISEATFNYWDAGGNTTLGWLGQINSGRFAGSRSLVGSAAFNNTSTFLVKSSNSNDTTHHLSVAIKMTTLGAGTGNGFYFTFFDGTTAQCSIIFKNNGDIFITSGAGGSTLDTYTAAYTVDNTWFQFEIEVVINNSTGSFKVRKNGNTSDDHSITGINTRVSANNYANKLSFAMNGGSALQQIDDLLWRSDATVAWAGDIRCFTRVPVTDSSVQFTPSSATCAITPFVQGTTTGISTNSAKYAPFIATASGTVATAILSLAVGYTGNMKCSLFNDTGSSTGPGTVLASATAVSNPVTGNNTFTFGSPPSVTQGTLYWIGFDSDTNVTNGWNVTTSIQNILPPSATGAYANNGVTATVTYASFPTATPSVTAFNTIIFTVNVTPTTANNAMLVGEVIEDLAGTYVSSSTVNNVDFYTPSSISSTPTTVVAVVTRALCQKTDAGSRNIALQVKSGLTTSTGTSTALGTAWGWIFKIDQVDPDTGVAWTAIGVNNAIFGPKLTV